MKFYTIEKYSDMTKPAINLYDQEYFDNWKQDKFSNLTPDFIDLCLKFKVKEIKIWFYYIGGQSLTVLEFAQKYTNQFKIIDLIKES